MNGPVTLPFSRKGGLCLNVNLPAVGLRNLKTAVAVMVCYVLFLPIRGLGPVDTGSALDLVGPFYACIAAVICMQSSVEHSLQQGISRIISTLVGGATGLLVLSVESAAPSELLTTALLGASVVFIIWLCNLIGRPAACSTGCIVCCAVILSHSGAERYFYTLARTGETIVGILTAIAVNRLLPDRRPRAQGGPDKGQSSEK